MGITVQGSDTGQLVSYMRDLSNEKEKSSISPKKVIFFTGLHQELATK
ncbi:hypothetical protein STRDD10_01686 [Streptococcus sp. DD10]|nr:hypothetical protein STRDD10_01686 [Streptococcus sp. DD10]